MRLITPEDIASHTVEEVIEELKRRVSPQVFDNPKGYKYKKYQQKIQLCHDIEDLHPYDCILPNAPPIEQFINYGLFPDNQTFQRIKFPEELLKIDKEFKYGRIDRSDAIAQLEASQELIEFVERLWLKRLTGDWQIINGIPTHISPTYFFYLNFWNMDIGLPHFRSDTYHHCGDLQLMYCWDYLIVPNPYCYGLNYFTQRRVGKSFIGGAITYEPISRSYEWHGGIQSKTDVDGTFTHNGGKIVVNSSSTSMSVDNTKTATIKNYNSYYTNYARAGAGTYTETITGGGTEVVDTDVQ